MGYSHLSYHEAQMRHVFAVASYYRCSPQRVQQLHTFSFFDELVMTLAWTSSLPDLTV